ncbi:MAG: aspartate aminotransferase family protein [Acidobacteria bacterium]|nr:aspartate aminotransferase family protein [Acidobacteriota bacterium]MYI74597.1 aspartate aminotransferase family protein [Acidobacteriota bacterium]
MTVTNLTNAELIARDQAHLVHPLHEPALHDGGRVWVKGDGALLTDADGRECIDALAGLWNVTAGHGRRELAEAMREQASTLPYCSGYSGNSNPRAIELAECLAVLCYPSINHFFFTSGGGEATESSIKLSRAYWKMRGRPGKTKVISRVDGYHGVTLAAMSATGIAPYWPLFEPRVPGFAHIPSPYPYRYEAPPGISQGIAAANELEQAILREGPDSVAMFIAEPVQGAGGVIVPQDDYFPRIREICNEYDVLLVADEVITGFGRTGEMFALNHWGVEPDIMQFAKAITSGYFPFGGIGISDRIADTLREHGGPWMHAYTYSAHPVGCAVALRTLRIIEDEQFPEQAAAKGRYLLDALRGALADHPHVGDIRGKGLMCGVELVEDKATKRPFPAGRKIGPQVLTRARERGMLSRVKGDSYLLAPPIVITHAELDRCVEILSRSIDDVLG